MVDTSPMARDAATARSGELGTPVLPFRNPGADGTLTTYSSGINLMADAFFQSIGAMSLPLIFLALALMMVFAFGGFAEASKPE